MTGRLIRIPYQGDPADQAAFDAACEWILTDLSNSLFGRTEPSISSMHKVAERELKRPRDDIHRRWAEIFIRETNEIEFDHIKPEIRKLVQRGNVTPAETAELRCNSWEWEALVLVLSDEAFIERMQHALKNCATKERPFVTYDAAVQGLYAPELLKRFGELLGRFESEKIAARDYAETIDNVREALGQDATHYLVIAGDVKDLVEAVERDDVHLSDTERRRELGEVVFYNEHHAMDVLNRLREEGRRLEASMSPDLGTKKEFSHKDVEAILRNLGVDPECGACAAIAYTGFALPGDGHTCKSNPAAVPNTLRKRRGILGDHIFAGPEGFKPLFETNTPEESSDIPPIPNTPGILEAIEQGTGPGFTENLFSSEMYEHALIRNPNGNINNCSLANLDEEKNCQVCSGRCPDRERFK